MGLETELADVLVDVLRERYGITHADVEANDAADQAGLNSLTWWVSVDDERCYVAKWVADGSVGSLAAGVRAAALAEASGVATGAAVEAVGGDRVLLVDGGSLVLMHHLDGTPLGDDDGAVVGRTLASVHGATAGHDGALGLGWPWIDLDEGHLDPHPDLRAAVVDALADLHALPALVTGVAHGDPAPEAFLLLGDGSVALIDWAGAMTAPLLYDVASAALYLGGLDDAAPMLAAYASAGGPATPDLPHLATMLRFRWAVQASYFARRLAASDLTGTDEAGNDQGLDDARRHLLGA